MDTTMKTITWTVRLAPHAPAIPAARAPIANIKNTKLTLMTSTMPHTSAARIHSHQVFIALPLLLGHTARPPATIGATGEQRHAIDLRQIDARQNILNRTLMGQSALST